MRCRISPRPTIVCAQAGNVNTGAFDPLAEIARRARDAGAWLHVDGAFGLWAACAPRAGASRWRASELADSWATDAHKWLNVPYDSGLAFVRDAGGPARRDGGHGRVPAAAPTASATRRTTRPSSRGARAASRSGRRCASLGRSGLDELVERICRHARASPRASLPAGYEILNDVVLNQVLVSFGEPAATQRVIAGVQAEGTCWCGGTVWQGRTAMRISVSSWATTDEDVERSLEAMLRVARETSGL